LGDIDTVAPVRGDKSKPIEKTPLPIWIKQAAKPLPRAARPLMPSRPEMEEPAALSPLIEKQANGNSRERGRLIHLLLQSLPNVAPNARGEIAKRLLAQPVYNLAAAEQKEITEEVLRLFALPDYSALLGPQAQAEVPITGHYKDRLISGQIDRLLITPDEIHVLDYKTNRPVPENVNQIPVAYIRQLASYRVLLQQIYKGRLIHCTLIFTNGPKLFSLNSELLDRYSP
jgi:ATP-dependent helicase/nuclease subunit A